MTRRRQSNYGLTISRLSGLCMLLTLASVNRLARAEGQLSVHDDLKRILGPCVPHTVEFDDCMKEAANQLRAYFPTGIPEFNIAPFDPHRSPFVELRRGDQNVLGGFKLILRDLSEFGWTSSHVTKFTTDYENNRIIYTQYFPEKSLQGTYEFNWKALGTQLKRKGYWNLTLYDYSQTTSIRRLGGPGALLKVHVEVDHIGGMKLHITDILLEGRQKLNNIAEGVINSMWPIGLPFIQPIINELVSTAFTDIFNESFRYFRFEQYLGHG